METLNPLALLTRDGWHHVLSCLEHPGDFRNTASAHRLFLSILESDLKQEWMSSLFVATFPYFSKYMSLKDLLNLRLVSKASKFTVNGLLESNNQVNGFVQPRFKLDLYKYLDPENVHENIYTLLGEMLPLPITKMVGLSVRCSEIKETFQDCRPFFREFGSQVLNLSLEFDEAVAPHPLESLKFLKDILDCVPNLHTLYFRARTDLPELAIPPSRLWKHRVKRLWHKNPLPVLPHLKTVKLQMPRYRDGSIPYALSTIRIFMRGYGHQLRRLDISRTPIFPRIPLPYVKDLKVWLWFPEQLENLQASGAPLQKMVVYIGSTCRITAHQFFLAIETFKATLTFLRVYNNSWEFGRIDRFPAQVDLPLLRKLYLDNLNGSTGPSFPFLEKFQRLKFLKIILERPLQRESAPEEVDRRSVLFSDSHLPNYKRLLRSSIWSLLPHLKMVRFKVRLSPTQSRSVRVRRSELAA